MPSIESVQNNILQNVSIVLQDAIDFKMKHWKQYLKILISSWVLALLHLFGNG